MNHSIAFALLLIIAAAWPAPAAARQHQAKSVRLILPFPAGGGSDLIARDVAP